MVCKCSTKPREYAVAIITHLLGRISEKEHSWKGGPATQSNA
jgi:hypothetical protein